MIIDKLLAEFADKHAALQHDWTTAAKTSNYDKAAWIARDHALCAEYRQRLYVLDYHGPLLPRMLLRDPFQIHVGSSAARSSIAVLALNCDVEVPEGQEVYITRRPQVPFLPEHLAISWTAANHLDVLNLKIGNFSLFSRADEIWPGKTFAAHWSCDPPEADIYNGGAPLPTVVTAINGADVYQCLGREIPLRACQVAQDIQLHIRAHAQERLPAFEVILLGRITRTTIHFSGGSLDGQTRFEHGDFPRSFVVPAQYKGASIYETYVRSAHKIDTDASTCISHMDLDQIQMLSTPSVGLTIDADAELAKALIATIHKAGCPGSSVEHYGLVPAVEAVVNALHAVQEQRRLLQSGAAYKQLSDTCDEQQQHIQALETALGSAANMLESQMLELPKIAEWRALLMR